MYQVANTYKERDQVMKGRNLRNHGSNACSLGTYLPSSGLFGIYWQPSIELLSIERYSIDLSSIKLLCHVLCCRW